MADYLPEPASATDRSPETDCRRILPVPAPSVPAACRSVVTESVTGSFSPRVPLVVFISIRVSDPEVKNRQRSPLTVVPANAPANAIGIVQSVSPLTVTREIAGLSTPDASTSPLIVLTFSVPATSRTRASPLTVST